MSAQAHLLDHNHFYPLTLNVDPAAQTLRITLDTSREHDSNFVHNLYRLLNCTTDLPEATSISKRADEHSITFHPIPERFTLDVGGEPLAHFERDGDSLKQSGERPLTVSDTRMIGTHHGNRATRYKTSMGHKEFNDLVKLGAKSLVGDFHTHSSGQISAQGLIKVGLAHKMPYPLHLLRDIGIDVSRFEPDGKEHTKTVLMPRIRFQPLEPQKLPEEVWCVPLDRLDQAELDKLQMHMSLRADRQSSFSDAEYKCYRLRYPFAKNLDMVEDIIKETARESHAMGIDYSVISYAGLDNPELFKRATKAIWDIEHGKVPGLEDVKVRLKHGIPRSFTREQFATSLTRARTLLKSPYVVRVDVLGYETNKLDDNLLRELAAWMKTEHPEAGICVHAGENDKNPVNVKQVLRLGLDAGVRVDVGHGIYGLDDEAIEMAKQLNKDRNDLRAFIEVNPDSNIALNNIDTLADIKFEKLWRNGIPFVVSSDSYGLYRTTSEQLATSLIQSGFRKPEFDKLRKYAEHLKSHQLAYSHSKAAAIPGWDNEADRDRFINGLIDELAEHPMPVPPSYFEMPDAVIGSYLDSKHITYIPDPHDELPADLALVRDGSGRKKHPIGIIGASGSSWERIGNGHKREISIAYDMLVHAIDPNLAYFVQGRAKAEGVNNAVNNAMKESGRHYDSMGMLANPKIDNTEDYSHLTHMSRIKGELDIADDIAHFLVENGGSIIAAGGALFTRDIITKADRWMRREKKGTLLLMDGPAGASTDKARTMDEDFSFKEGKELLRKFFDRQPDCFFQEFKKHDENGNIVLNKRGKPILDEDRVQKLYNEAAERVGNRWGLPGTGGQTITEARTPDKPRARD